MQLWWEGIPTLERVMFVLASSASLILLIQTIMLIFSGHGADMDLDSDVSGLDVHDGGFAAHDGGFAAHDGSAGAHGAGADSHDVHDGHDSADGGLKLFTVRGIVGFLAVGGWAGIVALECGIVPFFAIGIALGLGFLALYGIARMMNAFLRFQENGTMQLRDALGKTGDVYIPIPAAGSGLGKVNVVVQERCCEFDAVSEGERIPTGAVVRVVDIIRDDVLVVEREE